MGWLNFSGWPEHIPLFLDLALFEAEATLLSSMSTWFDYLLLPEQLTTDLEKGLSKTGTSKKAGTYVVPTYI